MGSDLTLLLDEIPPQQRATRNSVYTTVAAVMRWQAARMDGYTPPLSKEHKKMFAGIEDRERDLSDAEIKKLWAACEQQGEFGAFCQFALLCGQRRQKIADMLWADLDGSTWRVRRTDGEKNTPKASPLPPLAMAILAKLDRSSTRVWSLSVHHSKYKAQLDAACSLEHWTLHDLRRTCRTILTDLGVRYDVGEQVLGHRF